MNSILTSIKKLLGITEEYTHFDADLIMHINSVLMALRQMGIGPSTGFSITGPYETWEDFLGDELSMLESVKSYTYHKVRLMFDPPTSSAVTEATNNVIKELEWRLFTGAEFKY